MAIKLKSTKTFTPAMEAQIGVNMTNGDYYGAIDSIQYDKKDKSCFFSVEVYGTQDSRNDGGTVVDRINFNFHSDVFDLEIGDDGLNIPEAYSKCLETLTDWESDE